MKLSEKKWEKKNKTEKRVLLGARVKLATLGHQKLPYLFKHYLTHILE